MPLRRAARKTFRLQCQIVRDDDFALISEETLDLSKSGVRVRTTQRILTGEPVIVSIRDPRTQAYVDATAIVVRVEHGRRRREEGGRALGIEFDSLDEQSQETLSDMLAARRFAAA